MLNNFYMVDIRLASLVYLLVYVTTYCVPIALLRQNKPFRLLCLGHAQITSETSVWNLRVKAILGSTNGELSASNFDRQYVHFKQFK